MYKQEQSVEQARRCLMIASFANQMTEDLFHGMTSLRVREGNSAHLFKIAERKLDVLNATETLDSLRQLAAHHSVSLDQNPQGKYRVPIGDGWFLAFRWKNEDAYDVEIIT